MKPIVEEMESKKKLLEALIPPLQECQEEMRTVVVKALDSTDKLIEKLQKYRGPKFFAAAKEVKKTMSEAVVAVEKLFTPPPSQTKQTISEYLESRKRRIKK